MSSPQSDHFKGKSVSDHLREARLRGAQASAEVHGTEMPGFWAAAADAAKETAVILLFFSIILKHFAPNSLFIALSLIIGGFFIWKIARSALLGWARMERLHRVIEEERWEIEHHRMQEKEELKALYRTKGLEGKLLDEVVEVLMSDDNRLLHIMLEEELGLTLEVYEHPLKQSIGAGCGVLFSAFLALSSYYLHSFGIFIGIAVSLIIASAIAAKLEGNRRLPAVVWNLTSAFFGASVIYFLIKFIYV